MTSSPVRVVVARSLPHNFSIAIDDRIDVTTVRTDEELRRALTDAEVLFGHQVPKTVPQEAPALRWIQLPSAGSDHLHAFPVWTSDVVITSARGLYAQPVAEHTLAMLLALTRQIPAMVRAQEQRNWIHNWRGGELHVSELRGKTLGIVGWGKIGDGVAYLARAFGMRIVGTQWSLTVPREVPRNGLEGLADPPWLEPLNREPDVVFPSAHLHEVLAQSDVVVVILPLTRSTVRTFGPSEFRAMKRGALFLNVGRGAVVDEEALLAALRSGHVAGAGLDVFDHEPLPHASPLWDMPNVLVSPHVAGMSDVMQERTAHFFALNLARYLDGQPLFNVVDRNREY
ncbi:MAG: D-2-hydroxyacid dehydrogenase [Chloroflexota bacterium]